MSGTLTRLFNRCPTVWEEFGDKVFGELFDPLGVGDEDGPSRVVISDENVSKLGRCPLQFAEHLGEFRRLAERWGFERVRLLVSIRSQATWLASAYAQISDRRAGASQSDFEEWVRRVTDRSQDYYKRGIGLDYLLYRRACVETLGQENVLLLPYEFMQESPAGFFRKWFQFLECPEKEDTCLQTLVDAPARNVRSSSEDTWEVRDRAVTNAESSIPVGQLLETMGLPALGLPSRIPLRWPDLAREKEIRLTPSIREQVVQAYRQNNRRLAEDIGRDLGRYGYY